MKNFKKIALAAMVAVLAVGFSAFTNAPKAPQLTNHYYNITNSASSDAADFVYDDGGTDECQSNPSDQCSVEWKTDVAPSMGDSPADLGNPTIVSGSEETGDYNGSLGK